MIPNEYDICISLDLDEIMAPGWKEEILKIWNDDIDRLKYVYNWYIENDIPKISFYADKIHKRNGCKWIYPVHEVLKFDHVEKQIVTDNIIINHYPDREKSRANYLPLLELSIQENPLNDRNMHYLGREYMYYGRWNDAIDTLIKHLRLESATWKDERCASMRFISRCYKNLNRYDEAETLEDYNNVCKYGKKALKIKNNTKTYINEVFSYDETLYDLLSIAYFNLNYYKDAVKSAKLALKINPNNERIKNNLKIFESTQKAED